ncbi:Meiotic activator RIM4 [Fusarium acutatum]|uniref:Meiotic activator RIM4 n=1 Tax=Fusarium acutatum TaxID=78861 RepID=A0A8H4NHX2_9HYPO|nr:Meiotic activator RIM4 [Fusarium acutatum]
MLTCIHLLSVLLSVLIVTLTHVVSAAAAPINHRRMVSSVGLSQEEQEFLEQHRPEVILKPEIVLKPEDIQPRPLPVPTSAVSATRLDEVINRRRMVSIAGLPGGARAVGQWILIRRGHSGSVSGEVPCAESGNTVRALSGLPIEEAIKDREEEDGDPGVNGNG